MGPADSFRTVRGLALLHQRASILSATHVQRLQSWHSINEAVNGVWLPLTTRRNQQLHHARLGRVRGGQDQDRKQK